MTVAIAALYGAALGTMNVLLAANVTRVRAKTQVFLGTADSDELLLAVRRHANHTEYTALFLVLLGFAELEHTGATVLHALGATYTLGRIAHAIGVGSKPSPLRAIGAVLGWLTIVGAGVFAVMSSMSGAR